MRLIDADKLEELFRETIAVIAKRPDLTGDLEHMIRASAMAVKMIEDAPTVEERKKGRWIHEGLEASYVRCSSCGWRDYTEDYSNYCPRCGADMREGNG